MTQQDRTNTCFMKRSSCHNMKPWLLVVLLVAASAYRARAFHLPPSILAPGTPHRLRAGGGRDTGRAGALHRVTAASRSDDLRHPLTQSKAMPRMSWVLHSQHSRLSGVRCAALPEGTAPGDDGIGGGVPASGADVAAPGTNMTNSDAASPSGSSDSPTSSSGGSGRASGEAEAEAPARGSAGGGKGAVPVELEFIGKLSRRLADSFPLLTADEITSRARELLDPESKGQVDGKVR